MRQQANIEKLPPQSIEAEQSVLGSVLIDGESIVKAVEIVSPDDFYKGAHKKILTVMLSLFDRNEAIDIITVADELKKNGAFEETGGLDYLTTLANTTPTSANIIYYAKIVKDRSLQRMLLRTASDLAEKVYIGDTETDALMDMAEQKMFEISEKRVKSTFVPMKAAIKDTFKMIESLYDRNEAVTGVPTGFKDLDEITAGLQKGDLVIVGGRPSAGKTAFGLNIAQYVGIELKEPVAIFSLEMSLRQIILRMLCAEAKVDASSVRRGYIKNSFTKLATAAGKLMEAPIFVDETSGISALEMRAKARRLKRSNNISLILVDYLQLMKGSGNYEQRVQEISEISRSLKALAKEIDVPVIALSQLNRSVERERRAPNMSDLRESGAIEQDADVIMFLYRDKEKNQEDERGASAVVNLDIAKQRNGPTGSLKLTFLAKYTRFENYSAEDASYMEEEAY
ncbi:MAG: replicative DNA helicase [Nitrospiraceae bacterium]|nr:replicative DNA helicase [Nitrospiraceae bacterium]